MREQPDRERRRCRHAAANVVARSHGCGANFGRKQFGNNRAKSRKKSRSEERHERPQNQKPSRSSGNSVNRNEQGSDHKIGDVALPASKCVGGKPESGVAEPLSNSHDDEPSRCLHEAESSPALPNGKREIGWNPSEQAPVAE